MYFLFFFILLLCLPLDDTINLLKSVSKSVVNLALQLEAGLRQLTIQYNTSSSVVAERPRDALCPSVVSFNSTIPRAQSFVIVTYYGAYN